MAPLARAIIEPFESRGVLQNPPGWFRAALGAVPSKSGAKVDAVTALGSSAVLAACRILANSLAALPLKVYRRTERGKEPDPAHPLYRVLHERPNSEQTSFEWRELLMMHLLLRGNAYSVIEQNQGGEITDLWPLRPDQVSVSRPNPSGGLVYRWEPQLAKPRTFVASQILHIRWLCQDGGATGVSPITLAREAVGLSLATEEYGARFFSNSATPSGVLQHPQQLSQTAYERIQDSWEDKHQGLSNPHKMAILEEGLTWQKIGVDPEDAQFLETRKFQLTEIARIFGVPPHLLADLERATFSNVEHQGTEFLTHTMLSWLVRWEQAMQAKLFFERDRETHFAKFVLQAFMRGDTTARTNFYAAGRQWGWLSANDIRELEDQNAIEGGDEYLVPMNMEPSGEASKLAPQPLVPLSQQRSLPPVTEHRGQSARRRLQTAYEPLYLEAATRLVRREIREVRKAAERALGTRNVDDFGAWLETYYGESGEFRGVAADQMGPLYESYMGAVMVEASIELGKEHSVRPDWIAEVVAAFAVLHAESSRGQLTSVLGDPKVEPSVAVEARLGEWQESRAAKIAKRETVRANQAAAKKAWKSAGVTRLMWVASGENCPYCAQLNGKIVGIEQHFAAGGDVIEAEGHEPLRIRRDVGHPPAHQGCDCAIVPAA